MAKPVARKPVARKPAARKPAERTPVAQAPQREAQVSPARWAAFQVLERVANSDAHSDDLLHGPMLAGLSPADTGLANALVMGVLRMQLVLEARLLPLLSRPDAELPSAIATVLRMGALQLLFLDRIPPHAALNESVELVRKAGQPQAAGMVNAVLRKIAAADKTPKRRPIGESVEAMAERLGHPEWLAARWVAAYGRKNAEAICGYDLQEPEDGVLFTAGGPAVDDGSRLVAELAAAAAPGAARVWDACAAPGGKTVVLAQRLPEAEIVATDVSPKRLARLVSRLEREVPGRVRAVQGDAAKPTEELGIFDLILCDAPCTGTGTLARNPEIKVRLAPSELDRQPVRQRAILAAALQRLAPGGTLVYSTCSLEAEENDSVVADVLRGQLGITLAPIEPLLDGLVAAGTLQTTAEIARGWVRGGFLRTLPGENFAGDGFFAAVFQRGVEEAQG